MKKYFFLALVVVLLTSCNFSGQQNQDVDFNKGQEGVTLDIMEQAPPRQVYEGSQFSVQVRIHNKGASDLPLVALPSGSSLLANPTFRLDEIPGRVTLSYDEFYVSEDERLGNQVEGDLDEKLKNISLLGKSDIVPDGESESLTVGYFRANEITGQRESPETQIYASICYPYRTQLSTDVCFDANTQGQNQREQVCSARDFSFSAGQGAPVSITQVEVDMVPLGQLTRPSFVIHMKNTGAGTVLRALGTAESLEDVCAFRNEDRGEQSTVRVRADIAGVELECKPSNPALRGGTGKVHCLVPSEALSENQNLFGRQDNFVTSLNVDLWYYYASSDSRTIEIERTATEDAGEERQRQTGECLPWQQREDGACTNRCGFTENTQGFSCGCSVGDTQDLPRDRYRYADGGELCPPGVVCCLKEACEDHDDDRRECTDATESGVQCSYCDETDECVKGGCEACEYEAEETSENVCTEVETDETE